MVVEVLCVREGASKIRARIVAFINDDGKRFEDVYDNSFNCRFPRNIRAEGKRFHVPDVNVRLLKSKTGTCYYAIKPNNIEEIQAGGESVTVHRQGVQKRQSAKAKNLKTYEVSPECVICMSEDSNTVFVPCGHLCTCQSCGHRIQKCCICRQPIQEFVDK